VIDVVTVKSGGTLDVRLVDTAWSENTVTFNNQPGVGGPQANIPVSNGDAGDTVSVDVTALVQGWADGTIANYGLALTSSSINVRLGSKEGGAPAKLKVTVGAGGTPTGTTVRVPQDFKTIQSALDARFVTWCAADAPRCTITIGPGTFDVVSVNLLNSPTSQVLVISGAGQNSTVIGPLEVLGENLLEVWNLTVQGEGSELPFQAAIYNENSAVDLYNVNVLNGNSDGFLGAMSNARYTLTNCTAREVDGTVDLYFSDVSGDVSTASTIHHSKVGSVQLDDADADVQNSIIGRIDLRSNSSLRIRNSTVKTLYGYFDSHSDVAIANSTLDSVPNLRDPTSTLKCVNVVNDNLDQYQSDCTLPAP